MACLGWHTTNSFVSYVGRYCSLACGVRNSWGRRVVLFASLVCRNPKTPAAAISYHAADSQPRGSEDAPSRAGLCFHPGFLRGRRQQPLAMCPRSEPRSNLDPASRMLALRHPRHSRACEQLIQRCVFEYRAGAGRNRARRCSTGFRRTRNSQTSRQHANSLEPRTGSRARPVTNLELRAAGNRWDAVGQALCCVACAVPFCSLGCHTDG